MIISQKSQGKEARRLACLNVISTLPLTNTQRHRPSNLSVSVSLRERHQQAPPAITEDFFTTDELITTESTDFLKFSLSGLPQNPLHSLPPRRRVFECFAFNLLLVAAGTTTNLVDL